MKGKGTGNWNWNPPSAPIPPRGVRPARYEELAEEVELHAKHRILVPPEGHGRGPLRQVAPAGRGKVMGTTNLHLLLVFYIVQFQHILFFRYHLYHLIIIFFRGTSPHQVHHHNYTTLHLPFPQRSLACLVDPKIAPQAVRHFSA